MNSGMLHSTREIEPGLKLGTDTFRGALLEDLDASRTLRPSLYSKNQGHVTKVSINS